MFNNLIKLTNNNSNILIEPRAMLTWAIEKNVEKTLQREKALNPFMLIIVASQSSGSTHYCRIWEMALIPLFSKKHTINFFLPGTYEIYGKIIWDKYNQKPRMDTINLLEYGKGIKVDKPTRSHYLDGFIELEVSQEFFSKSKYEKWKFKHPELAKIIKNLSSFVK